MGIVLVYSIFVGAMFLVWLIYVIVQYNKLDKN